jgi:1-acyl-sn-glycerol-3-phosphate acyltransferase
MPNQHRQDIVSLQCVHNAEAPDTAPPQGLGALLQALLFYTLLAAFALICLLWSIPAGLLAWLLPPSLGRPLGQRAIFTGFRLYVAMMKGSGMLRCDLSGLDALREERGIVIAANHPSLLDAVLLLSRLPRVVCIAKASIWKNVLLGGGMRLAGYVRNDTPLPMIRHSAEAVRAGRQLLIFPEGTRTPKETGGMSPGPLSRSFAVTALQAGAAVQTVLIECESDYLRKGVPLLRIPRLPLRYHIRIGRRFEGRGSAQALSQDVEEYLSATLSRPTVT